MARKYKYKYGAQTKMCTFHLSTEARRLIEENSDKAKLSKAEYIEKGIREWGYPQLRKEGKNDKRNYRFRIGL